MIGNGTVDDVGHWQQRLLERDLVSVCLVQDGTVVYANDQLGDLLEVEPDALCGRSVRSVVAEGDEDFVEAQLQPDSPSDADGREYTCTLVDADGATCPVEVHGTTITYDGAPATMAVILDEDDREANSSDNHLYRAIVENSRDIAYVFGPDGRTELVNQRVTEYTGIPVAMLEGTYLLDFEAVTGPESFARYADAVEDILTGERTDAAIEMESEVGPQTVIGEHRLTPIESDGEVAGVVGIARDVTSRKERERQLSQLKGVLARVMRHNLRNDVSAIRSNAELLLAADDDEISDRARTIIEKCDSLTDTSEKATRIERAILKNGDVVETDIGRLVEEVAVRAARQYPDASIEWPDVASVTVMAHDDLDIAIENMVENAVEYNESDDPWVKISVDRADDMARIRIADDGPGISSAEVAVLERREETALEHGSGAGLWLAATVAEASGGEFTIDRTETGTEAVIQLPVATAGDSV